MSARRIVASCLPIALGLLAVTGAGARAPQAPSPYHVFDCAGATWGTVAVGINDSGEVVGWYYDSAGQAHGFFRGTRGGCVTLDVPGAQATFAYALNDRGQIVGSYTPPGGAPGPAGDDNGGFIWERAGVRTYGAPGARQTVLTGINNRGTIVGWFDLNPGSSTGPDQGFVLDGDELTLIENPSSPGSSVSAGGINPQGEVVGEFLSGDHTSYGFVRAKDGSMVGVDFVQGGQARAHAMVMGINAPGDIAGIVFPESDDFSTARAFLQPAKGEPVELQPAGNHPGVLAGKINAGGDIAGAFLDENGRFRAFIVNKHDLLK